MTTNDIVVAVSPHYSGMGWVDKETGFKFEPTRKIKAFRISKDRNLTGIKNALRLNHLILLEGTLETEGEVDLNYLNPAMLTKQQFDVIIQRLAENGDSSDLIASLNSQIESLESDKTALQGEKTSLQGQVSTLEGEKTSLQGQVSTLEGEKTSLQGQVSTLEGQITELEQQIQDLLSQIEGEVEPAALRIGEEQHTQESLDALTKDEIKVIMDNLSIEYKQADTKQDLIDNLLANQ